MRAWDDSLAEVASQTAWSSTFRVSSKPSFYSTSPVPPGRFSDSATLVAIVIQSPGERIANV